MSTFQRIPFPPLPVPPSWYPGHMTQFTRQLPQLLRRTDIVIEVRDARLPLTSINRNFEGERRFTLFDMASSVPVECVTRPLLH